MWSSKQFWLDLLDRAFKTAIQFLLTALVGKEAIGILDVPWGHLANAGLLMVLISVLTSLASGTLGDRNTAALVSTSTPRA